MKASDFAAPGVMAATGHCKDHDTYDSQCGECTFARLVYLDSQPRVCICPILRPTLGGCPVHGG